MTSPRVGEVFPGLWVGAKPPLGKYLREHGTDVLVLCAYEFQPHDRLFPGVEVVRCPIDDHPPTKDERRLVRTVSILVSRFVKRGDHTLVTCQMGLNRSAFVAALAMIRLGCLPAEAIDRIRSVRGKDALFNESFERYILRFRLGR